jgi:type IV pilus assembly protein PilX
MPMKQAPSQREQGIVLFLTIVVLVAMSLAAVGLMRSVLGSNRVAGNLAFQQSAAQSAHVGAETAIAWLEQKSRQKASVDVSAERLNNDITIAVGEPITYRAQREDPAAGETWEAFWQRNAVWRNDLPTDAAGNTPAFMIHRLCAANGSPDLAGCEQGPRLTLGEGCGVDSDLDCGKPRMYYRITVRVEGPRNAISFSQAIVSI